MYTVEDPWFLCPLEPRFIGRLPTREQIKLIGTIKYNKVNSWINCTLIYTDPWSRSMAHPTQVENHGYRDQIYGSFAPCRPDPWLIVYLIIHRNQILLFTNDTSVHYSPNEWVICTLEPRTMTHLTLQSLEPWLQKQDLWLICPLENWSITRLLTNRAPRSISHLTLQSRESWPICPLEMRTRPRSHGSFAHKILD